jgi:hypothetical protein
MSAACLQCRPARTVRRGPASADVVLALLAYRLMTGAVPVAVAVRLGRAATG